MKHGSDGIPKTGREAEYAAELWADDPSAFWLHPEGPLSETTPEEWLAKQPKPITALRGCEYYQYQFQRAINSQNYLQNHSGINHQSGIGLSALYGGALNFPK